jgi:hypothetical protein
VRVDSCAVLSHRHLNKIHSMQVGPGTNHAALPHEAPWLLSGGSSQANAVASLVVKPDMLFGQRGKHDLVGLRLTWPQASAFIAEVREDPL